MKHLQIFLKKRLLATLIFPICGV